MVFLPLFDLHHQTIAVPTASDPPAAVAAHLHEGPRTSRAATRVQALYRARRARHRVEFWRIVQGLKSAKSISYTAATAIQARVRRQKSAHAVAERVEQRNEQMSKDMHEEDRNNTRSSSNEGGGEGGRHSPIETDALSFAGTLEERSIVLTDRTEGDEEREGREGFDGSTSRYRTDDSIEKVQDGPVVELKLKEETFLLQEMLALELTGDGDRVPLSTASAALHHELLAEVQQKVMANMVQEQGQKHNNNSTPSPITQTTEKMTI